MSSAAESSRHVLARQLPEIRARVGLRSAQELADRVQELGGRLDRAALSKIEAGTRNVSLDEALLLAVALGVAPVHLFLPRDDADAVVLANRLPPVSPVQARAWLRGVESLPGTDDRVFRTEVPGSEWEQRSQRLREAEAQVESALRRHRVARAYLETVSDDRAKRGGPSLLPIGRIGVDPLLGEAYREVAETRVSLDDAVAHERRVRAEERAGDER